MLRFFNKNISLEKLEELLQEGKGLSNRSVVHGLRKQFDLLGKTDNIFYEKLKHKDRSEAAFDQALRELPRVLPSSSKTAIHTFEYLWDNEVVQLLKSDDRILLQWTENYLVKRFYKIVNETRFEKYGFDESRRRSIFNVAFDQLIRRVQKGDFDQRSTLKTFFRTILHNEFVNVVRSRDAKKRLGDKLTFWEEDDSMVDDLIHSKGKIQKEFSKVDIDHLMIILNAFKKQNLECYELITKFYLSNISLAVLAERSKDTRNYLNVKRFNCMKKLRIFWDNNQTI